MREKRNQGENESYNVHMPVSPKMPCTDVRTEIMLFSSSLFSVMYGAHGE